MYSFLEHGVQSLEDGIVAAARTSTMRTIQRFLNKWLYSNCFVVSLVALVVFTLACFAPVFVDDETVVAFPEQGAHWDNYREAVSDQSYSKWLLVSIFVAIPLALELLMDSEKLFSSADERITWLAQLILITFFILPNTIMYCLIRYRNDEYMPNAMLSARFGMVRTQQVFFEFGLLALMFGHRIDYPRSERHVLLNFSVEKRTVNIMIIATLGRTLRMVGPSHDRAVSSALGLMFSLMAALGAVLLSSRMLYMQVAQYFRHGQFITHHHLSDFMTCCALLLFVCLNLIIQGIVVLDPPTTPTAATGVVLGEVFIQIAVTCIVQLISGRTSKRLAQVKHEKLETRLNLIRYVSHEMRTPLNTAFMGLTLLDADLTVWRQVLRGGEPGNPDMRVLRDTPRLGSASESNFNTPRALGETPSADDVFQRDPAYAHPINSTAVTEALGTLHQVNDSCKVALATLDDLLTFDKIDEQKLVVEMQDIDPWSFVCAAARPFAINAKQAQVRFCIHLCDRESRWAKRHIIRGDPFKLSQVLRNLISNALKFTPPDGIVEVRLERDARFTTKETVRVSVSDTGAGISSQNQKRLFGQYVQFNAGALQQGKGSGLGLWITKSIVQMHHGDIGVISEGEGHGSTFFVDLPLHKKPGRPRLDSDARRLAVGSERRKSRDQPLVEEPITTDIAASPSEAQVWDSDLNPGAAEPPLSARLPAVRSELDLTIDPSPSNRVYKRPREPRSLFNPRTWYGKGRRLRVPQDTGSDEEEPSLWRRFCGLCSSQSPDYGTPMGDNDSTTSFSLRSSRQMSSVFLNNPVRLWTGRRKSTTNFSLDESASRVDSQSEDAPEEGDDPHVEEDFLSGIPEEQDNAVMAFSRDNSVNLRTVSVDNMGQELRNTPVQRARKRSTGSLLKAVHSLHAMKQIETSGRVQPQALGERKISDSDCRIKSPVSLAKMNLQNPLDTFDAPAMSMTTSMSLEDAPGSPPVSQDRLSPLANERTLSRDPRLSRLSPRSSPQRRPVYVPPLRTELPLQGLSYRMESQDSNDSLPSDEESALPVRYASPKPGTLSANSSPAHHAYIRSPKNSPILSKSLDISAMRSSPLATSGAVPHGENSGGSTVSGRISDRTAPLSSPQRSRPRSWAQGLRIMVVDDSTPNRKICARLLSSHNHTVVEACDGLHCLQVFDEHRAADLGAFDVILLDDSMPRMTGPLAAQELRARGFRGSILGVTGDVFPETVARFVAHGADRVLCKPLNLDLLREHVETLGAQQQ